MLKMSLMSSSPTSSSVMIVWNCSDSSHALCISCTVIVPLPSLSISLQRFKNSDFCRSVSRIRSLVRCSTSISRASVADWTITARMRFITPRDTETTMPTKMGTTYQTAMPLASMTGIDTRPQLSPVMICWNSVRTELITVANAFGQRSQPSYGMWALTGWANSTRMMDQTSSMLKSSTVPKKSARAELQMPVISRYSSRIDSTTRKARVSRAILKMRSHATLMLMPWTASDMMPEITTKKSSRFHLAQKYLRRST
mmetsp:Transcript_84494/g.217613  ORF Transcript_84494/g.217613 Transcript_84494/m.217613 type:complete len:256 (-) Transcript_84494:645-1412(-)